MDHYNVQRIYNSILGDGRRAVPTYAEVRRDLRPIAIEQYRHYIS